MIAVPYIFSRDSIAEAVKQESSLHAVRKRNQDDDSLFEELVFDEEYYRKLRELFFDAQAEVMDRFSPYMQYEQDSESATIFEEADFTKDIDFTFTLLMPCRYNMQYNKQVSIKVREFIIAYIMYRWLETKVPEEAAVYKERSDKALMDARAYLEKRIATTRRKTGGSFF